jgi:HEAT repeat protein
MLAAVLALALAAPLTDAEVRERVDSWLGAIDRPVPAPAWRELGAAAVPHLEAALRSDELPTRRAAAVNGLAAIGGPRARAAILDAANAEEQRFVVRAAALRAAPRLVPRAELAGALRPALEKARSPQVRATAAGVLARSGGAAGCAAAKAQAARETGEAREKVGQAAARCR